MQLGALNHHPFDARVRLLSHIVMHHKPMLTPSDFQSGLGVWRTSGNLSTSGMLAFALTPNASVSLCLTTHSMEPTCLTSKAEIFGSSQSCLNTILAPTHSSVLVHW